MGIFLSLDIPAWEKLTNGGMKEIYTNEERFPRIWGRDEYKAVTLRPTDFVKWREELHKQFMIPDEDGQVASENYRIWMEGLDEMETNLYSWLTMQ